LASGYDTYKSNYDTIKRLYKVNKIYYYRKRINKKLIRISLRTKNIKVALYRKRILDMLGVRELFELKTKDYNLIFEYDTQEELKLVLEQIKDIQQSTITQKLNHYNDVKEKIQIAEESTNPLTFGLLENKYIANRKRLNKVSENTIKDDITTFKFVKEYFGTKYIEDIKLDEYEQLQAFLNTNQSNRTTNKHIGKLKSVIKWAYDRDLLEKDNIKAIELLDESKDQQERKRLVENYSYEMFQKIINWDYKEPIWNKLFKILFYTGMRSGELWNLKNEDIKEEDNIYYFDIKDSKTINGIRKVPIHNDIIDIVLDMDFNFCDKITKNKFQKDSRKYLYQAIKEEKENNKTFVVHTIRATFMKNLLTQHIQTNSNIVPILQEIVGHAKTQKIAITWDTYGKGTELEIKSNILQTLDYSIKKKQNFKDEIIVDNFDDYQ
jgi:integrase